MLANLMDIEEAMLHNSLVYESSAAVFFDFEAAFPSVSQEFLMEVISARGWPTWCTCLVRALYWNNRCNIVAGGAKFDGFTLTAGVRQGCPLSPLLFAVLSDVLFRRLARHVPDVLPRAYADDLAVVLSPGRRDAPILEHMFEEYALLSGLRLHHGKSVWVPLSLGDLDQVRIQLHAAAPTWSDFTIRRYATYLGFAVGPERAEHSWTKPLDKFVTRARIWRDIGCGLLLTLLAYRTYIFPVLGFVLQLDRPPADWDDYEQKACTILFPGPRGWAPPAALRSLHTLGFQSALIDARATAAAAKCRVYHWENVAHGGLQVRRRTRALEHVRGSSDYVMRQARWHHWYQHNFFTNLDQAHGLLQQKATSAGLTTAELMQGAAAEPPPRKQWQKRCRVLLEDPSPTGAVRHLSRCLTRLSIPLLPGRRLERATCALRGLARLVPPRVWASSFRALCNGLDTSHRMQRRLNCVFGCGAAEDSLRHYAFCPRVADFSRRRLGLLPPPPPDRLSSFIILTPPFRDDTASELARRALAAYAVYAAGNAARHGQTADAQETLVQYAREACASHAGLANIVVPLSSPLPVCLVVVVLPLLPLLPSAPGARASQGSQVVPLGPLPGSKWYLGRLEIQPGFNTVLLLVGEVVVLIACWFSVSLGTS
ncbi:unnamed protein product [Prorocentrum cordatum]|uniref:Reverse transcriptase domain-containing protein n=1 Tax=Prorocentrum cordatum TaxID=2364126 RepID=A0ABN9PSJ8_9DINO|nr:unnamed protein product [Polarella glacialis]